MWRVYVKVHIWWLEYHQVKQRSVNPPCLSLVDPRAVFLTSDTSSAVCICARRYMMEFCENLANNFLKCSPNFREIRPNFRVFAQNIGQAFVKFRQIVAVFRQICAKFSQTSQEFAK